MFFITVLSLTQIDSGSYDLDLTQILTVEYKGEDAEV